MTIRKREDTGNLKNKHQITLCGVLFVDEAMDLSSDRLHNDNSRSQDISLLSKHLFYFFSPGATTPIGGCNLQPSSGL